MDVFNFKDTLAPFALLEIISRFKQLTPGQMMEIAGIDEAYIVDLQRVLPSADYELRLASQSSDIQRLNCVRIRKRGQGA